MLRTTALTLTGWMSFILMLSAAPASASPFCGAVPVMLGQTSMGQLMPPKQDSLKRAQAADLLSRARDAMKAGDLDAAGRLIAQAEAIDVSYGLITSEYTPKKARRDLEDARATLSGTKPGGLFSPGAPKAPGSDPFAGRNLAGLSPAAGNSAVTPLPRVEPNVPGHGAGAAYTPQVDPNARYANTGLPAALAVPSPGSASAPGMAVAASESTGAIAPQTGRELLRAARRALAVGDVRRAGSLIQQARAQGIQYDPLDDTPDKVDAAIRKYQDITAQADHSEAYRKSYARMLTEQAEALLRTGDLEDAERLASEAARQRVVYGPLEAKPSDLLQRIVAARQGTAPSPAGLAVAASTGAAGNATPEQRRQALALVRQAREALQAGQFPFAESLAQQAERLRLPDSVYGPQDQPGRILYEIRQAQQAGGVIQAGAVVPAGGDPAFDRAATQAYYDASNDPTRNVQAGVNLPQNDVRQIQFAQDQVPTPAPPRPGVAPAPGQTETVGMSLFRQGREALQANQTERALDFFRQAARFTNELDPMAQQQLQDHLQLLSGGQRSPGIAPMPGPGRSPIDDAGGAQQALARQVQADLAHQEANARAMMQNDPKAAISMLEAARAKVESSGLDPVYRDQLLRRVDRSLTDMRQFVETNRPRIELDERNRRVEEEIDREQRVKLEVQEKYALLVNQFNQLMDEERWAEADVVAQQVQELDPENPVTRQVVWQSKFMRRVSQNRDLIALKEQGFIDQLRDVDESSVPFDTSEPYQIGDPKRWEELTNRRQKLLAEKNRNRTERDLEIERRLRTPVSLQFTGAPLSQVLEYLAKLAEVNLHLDPKGLAEEGVSSETPVTIEVRHEIMLKSALNLILEPLHLSYVIKDEVLKITSEQMRDGETYAVLYDVGDLVMPVPNFVPNPRMGLAGAYHDAMANAGFGGPSAWGTSQMPLSVVASRDGRPGSAAINPAVLAQNMGSSGPPSTGSPGMGPSGFGPGGLGGGVEPDFDALIELITTTIAPTTWDDVGGPGSIAEFETNLSLVISQTQQVHEQIVDLLQQLRRLQDLQVTIEVRFITLNDNFFERIGVDFDFDVDDNIDGAGKIFGSIVQAGNPSANPPTEPTRNVLDRDDDRNKNMTIGLSAPGTFSADLDIPFTQDSFSLAQPQFGGFDPAAGASIGFAILSDIEAFFFINAAQGDRRSNVLQAPKVTLFNGQQAFVSDTSQSPFVISVIPVVGDFAAAQQPVIVVLSEGTHLTVQAVVSNDKRYVRLTVVPFFSKIGDDVPVFQFTGSQTSTVDSSADGYVNPDDPDDGRRNSDSSSQTVTRSGTSVQLPTFSFITVTTTVSVPDGGTVLLGGIKRLSEGRNEFGVPILNKIPYLSRLFKNVGIGRETQSLMMMVTPRIIIQEEEEEKLGILPPE